MPGVDPAPGAKAPVAKTRAETLSPGIEKTKHLVDEGRRVRERLAPLPQTAPKLFVHESGQRVKRWFERGHESTSLSRRVVIKALLLTICSGVACASRASGTTKTLTGVVVDIRARNLGDVDSFTLRSGEQNFELLVDRDTVFAFAPGHLQEHLTTAAPVRVRAAERNGTLHALYVDDA